MKKNISILTPCFNEQGNVRNLIESVAKVFEKLPEYSYEHIFIDNDSSDDTVKILKEMALIDTNVKVILNARNFGHIRSPFYGMLQCKGDAVISLVADFQDPPELVQDFLKRWEEGYKIVIGIKNKSKENQLMFTLRKFFYNLL